MRTARRRVTEPFRHLDGDLILVRRKVLLAMVIAVGVGVAAVSFTALALALNAGRDASVIRAIECGRATLRVDAFSPAQAVAFERVCGVRLVRAGGVLRVVGARR